MDKEKDYRHIRLQAKLIEYMFENKQMHDEILLALKEDGHLFFHEKLGMKIDQKIIMKFIDASNPKSCVFVLKDKESLSRDPSQLSRDDLDSIAGGIGMNTCTNPDASGNISVDHNDHFLNMFRRNL